MLVVLVLVVAVGALLFIGVTAVAGALGSGRAGPPLALVAAGAVAVVVVLVGLTLGLGLARDSSGRDPGPDAVPTATTATIPRPAAPRPRTPDTSSPRADKPGVRGEFGPRVVMAAGAGAGLEPATAVGELAPGAVLTIDARGFPPFATVLARQCVAAICGNDVIVHLSESGTASFLFLTTDTLASAEVGGCRITSPSCSLVVENTDGEGRAEVPFLFHDAVPAPGRLRVEPARNLADGDRVTVHLDDFPAGARARIVMCASGSPEPDTACGSPGLDVPVAIGSDGTATASVTVRAGPVGADRVSCGRGSACALAVVSDDAFVRAAPATLRFRAPPGASYNGGRLAAGLAVAALFLLAAVVLVRRTDWSPLGEEAAPEIDDAEYADLDAIVAALPPEPDLDELIAALG